MSEAPQQVAAEVDLRILQAVIAAAATLAGGLISAVTAWVVSRAASDRDLRKERLSRAQSLTFERLVPRLYEPLLRELKAGQRRFEAGESPQWPYREIIALLDENRFLILMAPTETRRLLDALEVHCSSPRLSNAAREQRVREDLLRLEESLMRAYASYRLEA